MAKSGQKSSAAWGNNDAAGMLAGVAGQVFSSRARSTRSRTSFSSPYLSIICDTVSLFAFAHRIFQSHAQRLGISLAIRSTRP